MVTLSEYVSEELTPLAAATHFGMMEYNVTASAERK